MRQGLTVNERAFVEKYLRYRNGTKAVLETYDIQGKDKRKIASTMGSQILNRPRVREHIEGFVSDDELVRLLKNGLNATKDIVMHGNSVSVADWSTRIKCLELILNMKGLLSTKAAQQVVSHGKPIVKFYYHKSKML